MRRCLQALATRHRARRTRDRESGIALLMTISTLALLVALVSEFTYGTYVQAAQAANARDELRAHYMARSSVSLSRLLIKIQLRFIDPVMKQMKSGLGQASQALGGAAAGGAAGASGSSGGGLDDLGISLRVTDYAGTLMGFFGGSKDEASAIGGLIGLNLEGATGLGMKDGKMDAEITAEDGKIDINCGSGQGIRDRQVLVSRLLTALVSSPRYNKLFETPNADGQYVDRTELARAIIDWADNDEQQFNVDPSASGAEDYRYDARKDRYRAHNNSYDTVEEIGMVRGMDARFMEAFLPYLTVYASDATCKVNLSSVKGDCTPLLVGLIRAAATPDPLKPPSDLSVLDDNKVYPLASILCERGTAVGFDSLATIEAVLKNPSTSIARDDPRYQMMQSMRPVELPPNALAAVARVGSPRVYRIVATGESGKVKKKITAIVDTARTLEYPITNNPAAEKAAGVLQYWREE